MQLSVENYEYFAGRDDIVNAVLDEVREAAMWEAAATEVQTKPQQKIKDGGAPASRSRH